MSKMMAKGDDPEDVSFESIIAFPKIIAGIKKMGFERPLPIQNKFIPIMSMRIDTYVQSPRGSGKVTGAVIAAFQIILGLKPPQNKHPVKKICFIVPDAKAVDRVNFLLSVISDCVPALQRDMKNQLRCIVIDTSRSFGKALQRQRDGIISDDIVCIVAYRPESMNSDISSIFKHCIGRPQIVILSEDPCTQSVLNATGRSFRIVNIEECGSESNVAARSNSLNLLDNQMYSSSLRAPDNSTIERLKALDGEFSDLMSEYFAAWDDLKDTFLQRMTPLLRERAKELNTTHGDRTRYLPKHLMDVSLPVVPVSTQSMPGFWYIAMQNHPLIEEVLESHDEGPLRYLTNIDYEWTLKHDALSYVDIQKNTKRFTLNFHFAENPYFSNSLLTKTFVVQRSYLGGGLWNDMGEDVLIEAVGCDINWINNQRLVSKLVLRKQRNRKTTETRQIRELIPRNSFFNFFLSHFAPTKENFDRLTKTELEDLDVILEAEFEVGLVIRDKIIPNALGWYLGSERDYEFEDSDPSGYDEVEQKNTREVGP
eukprot:GHVH01008022.1.p1 GENE.GHVH01008022.1~~GHVH01008022.1.p1  ORF type:complete len:539 (-),score=62.58 GHVH01008022.1:1551-3167(-)